MPALVVAGLLVLATSVYGLGTLSTSVPRWIVVYLWAAVALCVFVRWVWRRSEIVLDRTDAAVLAFWLYAGLSLTWTPDWRQGAYSFVNLTAVAFVAVWVRHAPWKQVALLPGAAGFALFVAFLGQMVAPWDYGGHGNRTFQAELMLCTWALALGVLNHGAKLAVILLGLPVAAYLFGENGSKAQALVFITWGVIVGVYGVRRLLHRLKVRALDQHDIRVA